MYFLGMCTGLYPFIKLAKTVLNLLKIAVPIVLIVFGTIDFVKAVIASKDDDMKKAQNMFVKRVIYAVAFFLINTIVLVLFNLMAEAEPIDADGQILDVKSWYQCWNCTSKEQCETADVVSDRSGGFYSTKDVSADIDEKSKIVCSRNSSDAKYWCSIVEKTDSNDNSNNNGNGSTSGNNSGINDCKDGQCLK